VRVNRHFYTFIHSLYTSFLTKYFFLFRAYVIQTDSKTITLSATIAASVISCVSFLVCTLFGFILYFKWREDTENRKIRNKRLKRLINLPVHRAIIDKMETSDLLTRLNDEIYDYTSAKEKGKIYFNILYITNIIAFYYTF
jgi:hypothetical protein